MEIDAEALDLTKLQLQQLPSRLMDPMLRPLTASQRMILTEVTKGIL